MNSLNNSADSIIKTLESLIGLTNNFEYDQEQEVFIPKTQGRVFNLTGYWMALADSKCSIIGFEGLKNRITLLEKAALDNQDDLTVNYQFVDQINKIENLFTNLKIILSKDEDADLKSTYSQFLRSTMMSIVAIKMKLHAFPPLDLPPRPPFNITNEEESPVFFCKPADSENNTITLQIPQDGEFVQQSNLLPPEMKAPITNCNHVISNSGYQFPLSELEEKMLQGDQSKNILGRTAMTLQVIVDDYKEKLNSFETNYAIYMQCKKDEISSKDSYSQLSLSKAPVKGTRGGLRGGPRGGPSNELKRGGAIPTLQLDAMNNESDEQFNKLKESRTSRINAQNKLKELLFPSPENLNGEFVDLLESCKDFYLNQLKQKINYYTQEIELIKSNKFKTQEKIEFSPEELLKIKSKKLSKKIEIKKEHVNTIIKGQTRLIKEFNGMPAEIKKLQNKFVDADDNEAEKISKEIEQLKLRQKEILIEVENSKKLLTKTEKELSESNQALKEFEKENANI